MRTLLLLFALLLCLGNALAQDVDPLQFEAYPSFGRYEGKPPVVKLRSKRSRLYRTRLREAAAQGANFAGHLTVAIWGCGSGCRALAIIDQRTGEVYFTDSVLWVGYVQYQKGDAYEYRIDSRLLKVVGARNDAGEGTYYDVWDQNRLRLVRALEGKTN